MDIYSPGNIRILLNHTGSGAKVPLATPPEIFIKRADNGQYWDDSVPEFTAVKTALTMVLDVDGYYYYQDPDLLDVTLYEFNIISTDALHPFDVVEQFRISLEDEDPADAGMCRVTAFIFEADDQANIDPNRLNSDAVQAYAQIQGTYFNSVSQKYFDTVRMKPYYESTGKAYWIVPQGAEVKFFLKQLNINQIATIPALSTIDLDTLLSL